MDPLVSIIIPTYNRAGFVRTCLEALKEAGAPSYEAIVVDDGSTDDTEEVVAVTDPRAKFIPQANAGPAAARNNGFKHSRGKYICFLDCDDEWLPGQAAEPLAFLERHPEVDLVFADAQMGNRETGFSSFIEMAGQETFFQLPHNPVEEGFRILEREPFFNRLIVRNAVFLGATILRREAFETVGPFDTELCGAADWNLWMRMSQRLFFAYWQEPLAIYTQHAGGMSKDDDGMSREFCNALRKLPGQIPLMGEQKKRVQKQLHHHLFSFAYKAYARGDWPEARRRFDDVLATCGQDMKTMAYSLITRMPLGKKIRTVKQRLSGTTSPVSVQPSPVTSSALRPGVHV
jgi:glycosyltransferase involved in cell wall biosynthesis